MWPVFIPSRGRSGKIPTTLLGLTPRIVIEPQEVADYLLFYPQRLLRVLETNDAGISYARNAILDLAENADHIWVLNDDLYNWRAFHGFRYTPCDAFWALSQAETLIRQHRPALAGIPPDWKKLQGDEIRWNKGSLYGCVCIDMSQLRGKRFELWNMWEDKEFVLQARALGQDVIRLDAWTYTTDWPGTAPGGCAENYVDRSKRFAVNRQLAGKHPNAVKIAKNGCHYTDWKAFDGAPAPFTRK